MAIKNFQKKSSTYTCSECGKLTRDTGIGEAEVDMCAFCYEGSEWLNSVQDGDELSDVPEKFRKFVEDRI